MDNPPTREKFRLMSIIWFVLQKPFASLQQRTKVGSWKRLCGALFGLNGGELEFELNEEAYIIPDPTEYAERRNYHMERREKRVYGDLVETKRFVPEPILSHRIANLAILCMRYLNRGNKDTPTIGNFLHFWATQSQHSPWLWRRRLRVTSMGYQQPTGVYGPKYSFPQSLRRSMQGFHLAAHKSEDVYQEQYIFYGWTLNLLYHTLLKATKSDELVKALSKSFIPPVAYLLFPRRIRRVRKAVDAYLAKVSLVGYQI
jgi:hypothetical protein